jgi:hypothetical protein
MVAELIAIGSGLLLLLFVLYFCFRISKMETAVLPCKKCGKPAPTYLTKNQTVRKAETLFGGEAIPVPLCWECLTK